MLMVMLCDDCACFATAFRRFSKLPATPPGVDHCKGKVLSLVISSTRKNNPDRLSALMPGAGTGDGPDSDRTADVGAARAPIYS